MREEDRAVISLPDRLVYVLEEEDKLNSPSSAPSILQGNSSSLQPNDTREDSITYQKYDDGTEDSRFPECVSTCLSNGHPTCSPPSPMSTLTSEPLKGISADTRAIDLSLKFLNGLSMGPESDTSMMPGVRCTIFNQFSHSGLLVSNISKNIKGGKANKLVPEFTMQPGAKISTKLRESQARKIANIQRYENLLPLVLSTPSPSREVPNTAIIQSVNLFGSVGEGFTLDDSETIPSPSFQLSQRTPADGSSFEQDGSFPSQEGEEYTVDNFQGTVASSSEDTFKKRPPAPWSNQMLQPELQDPTGIMLAFDRMLDCFDQREEEVLNLSPHTVDTWPPDSVYRAELEDTDMDWFLPGWMDDGLGIPDFDESTLGENTLGESTLGGLSHLQCLQSKGSLMASDDTDSLSRVEQPFDGLELEPTLTKDTSGNQTMTTDGDSTTSSSLFLFQVGCC